MGCYGQSASTCGTVGGFVEETIVAADGLTLMPPSVFFLKKPRKTVFVLQGFFVSEKTYLPRFLNFRRIIYGFFVDFKATFKISDGFVHRLSDMFFVGVLEMLGRITQLYANEAEVARILCRNCNIYSPI